ncbi:putative late blight resistance protein homolog R1A-3 [Primulina tabacum]|uniref:putative late blight resistance protein homolog R1A-3 n=1 Tax=Primulina tabacum TaxID=48773 RepID=UPI003F5A4FB6
MAYAALLSLSQTLEQILDSDPYFFPCAKEKIESFHETVASLMAFLDNCPPTICNQKVNNLITQIRDSAYEAEDVFESPVATHFLHRYESESYEKLGMLPWSLEKMMEDIQSVKSEVQNFHHERYGVLEQRIQTLTDSSTQLVSGLKALTQVLVSDPFIFPFAKEKLVNSCIKASASLRAFLYDFPPISSQKVHALMKQIIDSTDDALDVFISLLVTRLPQKYGSDRYEKFKMFPQSLEKVMEAFESIEKEVNGIHEQRIPTLVSSSRPASRGNTTTNMVALDTNLEMELLDELVGGRSNIDILPIVGMGGIGKTTLARILYNSQLIKESFDIRGWVTISQTYNVREIVLGLLEDIEVPLDEERDAAQQIYQSLYDRKYLIVLDDVWHEQAWNDIKKLFPDNNIGSRIILTSRHSEVAAYVNSFSTYHEMQLLNEDSSWSLLRREIFLQNDCPPELVGIGKKIARQCQGLPLAISAIGGHLRKEELTEEYWRYVSESVSLVLKTNNDPSLEILTLSYYYLPHHLKACFLYFGSFQEDAAIDVSRTVKLWVAEGFVKTSRSNNMEEVAKEYLRDVIERNLIFVHEYDSFGKPKICGIHDLFRDICIREGKKEKFLCVLNRNMIPFDMSETNSQRRLILSPNMKEDDESAYCRIDSFSAIHSFICHGDDTSSKIKLPSRMLKVLIVRLTTTKFPGEILELVNLKYLELGCVFRIPSSISRLKNLQTLISDVVHIKSMPSEIWEMSQLRHLLVLGFHLPDIPDVHGKGTHTYILKNLQTLSEIINFRSMHEVFTRIPNLKKLKIAYDYNAAGFKFNTLENLVSLCELESLCCKFNFVTKDNILAKLAFPLSLKKLVLKGCQIPWDQMTIIGVLPNLEVLKLSRATVGYCWETNDEEFKQLKFLLIHDSHLVKWKTETDHFPSLQHLILQHCYGLEAIPSEIGNIPTLEIIELDGCSHKAEFSAKEIVGEDSDIELKIVKT